jgi:hypothetical protein
MEELAKQERTKPQVETRRKCPHAIKVREVIKDARGRSRTIEYNLGCTIGHKKTTKNPLHKATNGQTWK